MKLSDKVKTALDETRMLILGAGILLGFQCRGAFAEAFDQLPAVSRYGDAVALGLMVCVAGLLIAPGPYHRIVEGGNDSSALLRLVTRLADAALLPFALALGLDVALTAERLVGLAAGAAAGVAFGGAALALWYALPRLREHYAGHCERATAMQHRDERSPTPLHVKIDQLLTEARVILPGVQALFGFQLAIVLTQSFEKLPAAAQAVHAVSLGLMAVAVILLMAPAAYHRIVFAGEDAAEMHRVGSIFVTAATVPLALGLAGDVYVVIGKIAGNGIGVAAAIGAALLLGGLWYGFPLAARGRHGDSAGRAQKARAPG